MNKFVLLVLQFPRTRLILLFIIASIQISTSQDSISIKYVKQHTLHFSIDQNKLIGPGAQFLKKEFDIAQFVLLGEFHGIADISYLTNAFLPELANRGFKHFCVEQGSTSTKLMLDLVKDKKDITQTLNQFYTDYYTKVKDVPYPFFDGKEDALFLNTAIQNSFNLFGIDQEYYAGTLLILEELNRIDSNTTNSKLFDQAKQFVIKHQLIDSNAEDYALHKILIESKELEEYFKSLDPSNLRSQEIIRNIKESWEIYNLYSTDKSKNLKTRSDLMKNQFSEYYKSQIDGGENEPKFLVKMGGYHIMKGLTYNGEYEIGTLIDMLADFNGTNDLNIAFMFRYMRDDDEPNGYFDNSDGGSDWLKERASIMKQGKMHEWTLIDLRAIKKDIINRKVKVYPAIKKMVHHSDLLLIPPLASELELNYTID